MSIHMLFALNAFDAFGLHSNLLDLKLKEFFLRFAFWERKKKYFMGTQVMCLYAFLI